MSKPMPKGTKHRRELEAFKRLWNALPTMTRRVLIQKLLQPRTDGPKQTDSLSQHKKSDASRGPELESSVQDLLQFGRTLLNIKDAADRPLPNAETERARFRNRRHRN